MSKPEIETINLRLSYASEPGDRLKDLGDGKVLIRNPNKVDRVLDRNTGQIVDRPYSEITNIWRDSLLFIGAFIVLAGAGIWLWK